MTIEEQTMALVRRWYECPPGMDQRAADIAKLVRAAVAAEREACARLAESMDDGTYDAYHGRDIAAAIRARSQK